VISTFMADTGTGTGESWLMVALIGGTS